MYGLQTKYIFYFFIYTVYFYLFLFFSTLVSSFWTSRGHRRRFVSHSALVFIFLSHIVVQQSHCSSIFYRELPTRAFALSASHFKKSPRIYTSVHLGGLELTKLTYARLEDNLILYETFGLFVFLPWGIPQPLSDWSLSCDHGLDYAS